jgi:hypothetical protein
VLGEHIGEPSIEGIIDMMESVDKIMSISYRISVGSVPRVG